jgi:hypothetical protein
LIGPRKELNFCRRPESTLAAPSTSTGGGARGSQDAMSAKSI